MNFKKFMALLLAVVMVFALAVPAGAVGNDDEIKIDFEKVENDLIKADTIAAEKVEDVEETAPYADSEMVRVSIVLSDKGTLDAGYMAMGIAENNAAMSYRDSLKAKQDAVANAISAQALDGAALDVVWNLTLAANIISANVPYGSIEDIKAVNGVADVFVEKRYEPCVSSIGGDDPNMSTSSAMIGSPAAYAAGYTGAGGRVAIIDTGLDTDHQSFAEGGYLYSLQKNAEKAGVSYDEYVAGLNLLTGEEVASVWSQLNFSARYKGGAANTYFTQKVPFGANYVDKGIDITHDNDSQGEHGSHVAGIAAANAYIAKDGGYVSALDEVQVQGVAPDAQFLIMKVFGKGGGAYDSDYMAAIEDAIVLGATSVNLSLGSGNAGSSKYEGSDTYQAIMDGLVNSNTLVVMSAGNAYNWQNNTTYDYLYNDAAGFDTVGSPGSYTNSLTVASVDNDGFTGNYLTVGDNQVFYTETSGPNALLTTVAGDNDYIFFENTGVDADGADLLAPYAGDINGKVVFCYRGASSFYQKMDAAAKAGAVACIIINNQPGTISMDLSSATSKLPCVSITQADGEMIKAASEQGENYYTGKLNISSTLSSTIYNSEYYTMSDFSSWGVPGSLELKPEITAPGGNIYSVNGAVKGGQAYEGMSGTSMAAPQVSGMAAVLNQAIKERGLEEQTGLSARQLGNSLLMSTAVPALEADTGNYYSVLKQGSGIANVGEAVNAQSYIMMFDGANAGAADGKIKVELGDDPDEEGVYGFGFTINNLTDEEQKYSLSADFFTQDVFDAFGDGTTYMIDTWTADLSYGVDWNVNGEKLEEAGDISNCDFNGDGLVDVNDVQALLDYDVKAIEITNEEYADINGDGNISAYDAYALLKILNEGLVTVPAGESVSVWVTVGLSDYQKEIFAEYYPVGAYIEGYVFAKQMPTAEGVKGTAHSIPVLGYYGNWSDAAMFDVGTYNEFAAGTEERAPYLYEINDIYGNSLLVKYADEPGTSYLFGGNPFIEDEVYMPERDAINNAKDDFAKLNFVAIRNASDSAMYIADAQGNVIGEPASLGPVDSAYYYYGTNPGWQSTQWSVGANGMIKGLEEDNYYSMNLTLVPEYYTMDGEWSFDELGEGATLSFGFNVDNTAPEIVDVVYSLVDKEFTITAMDNQYIAGIALFETDGETMIGAIGSAADAEAGDEVSLKVAAADLDDGKALLAVYDYALNQTTYKLIAAGASAPVESVTVDKDALELLPGNVAKLKAHVEPFEADETVIWTSSDEAVATVSETGLVTAVAKGECVITATSVKDETKFDECAVSVVTIPMTLHGVLQDENGTPMFFDWNLEDGSSWVGGAELPTDINSFAEDWLWVYGDEEFTCGYQMNTEGYMYQINMETGEAVAVSDAATAFGAPMDDMDFPFYSNQYRSVDTILGIYAYYLLYTEDDPMGNNFGYGYNLSSYLNEEGASGFTTLAWGGTVKGGTGNRYTYDGMFALDDANNLWELDYGTNSTRTAPGLKSLGTIPTDLNLDWPGYNDSMYCSMILGDDGNFYLSYFNGDTNEIYQLVYNAEEGLFNGRLIGNVGQGVWPCALYSVTENAAEEPETTERVAPQFDAMQKVEITEEAQMFVPAELQPEAAAEGSLNAAPISAGIQSKADLADDQSGVTVEVTIKDAEGNDVDANSADLVVAYDNDVLKVKSVEVNAQFKSVDVDEENGMIFIGLVDEESIAAGDTAATVTFSVLKEIPTEVDVSVYSVDEEFPAFEYVEELDVHVCPSFKFEDVKADDWYHEAVDMVVAYGIMSGVSETSFNPYGNVTRAQMVTVLYNMAGEPDVSGIENPFTDVAETDWFYAPVLWAAENGITSGVGDGLFAPNMEMNRQTMVVFLYNFAELTGGEIEVPEDENLDDFVDADDISSWATDCVVWAVYYGIVNGIETEDGLCFAPMNIANRAQLATVLSNIL